MPRDRKRATQEVPWGRSPATMILFAEIPRETHFDRGDKHAHGRSRAIGICAAGLGIERIGKYLRRVWTNHYLLNREALDDLLLVGAPEPGREDGASGAVRPKKGQAANVRGSGPGHVDSSFRRLKGCNLCGRFHLVGITVNDGERLPNSVKFLAQCPSADQCGEQVSLHLGFQK